MNKYVLKFVVEGPGSLEEHTESILEKVLPPEVADEEVEKRIRQALEGLGLRDFAVKSTFIEGPMGKNGLLIMVDGEYNTLQYVTGVLSVCAQAIHYLMADKHRCIFLNSNEPYDKAALAELAKGASVDTLWGLMALSPFVGDFPDFSIVSCGLSDLGFRDIELRQVPFSCNDMVRDLFEKFIGAIVESRYPPVGNLDATPKDGEIVLMRSTTRGTTIQFRLVHGGRHGRYRMVSTTKGIGHSPSQFATAQLTAQKRIGELLEYHADPAMEVLIRAEFEGFDIENAMSNKEYLWALVTDIKDKVYTMKLIDTPQMSIELSPEEHLQVSQDKIVDWAIISREEVRLVAGNFTASKEDENE